MNPIFQINSNPSLNWYSVTQIGTFFSYPATALAHKLRIFYHGFQFFYIHPEKGHAVSPSPSLKTGLPPAFACDHDKHPARDIPRVHGSRERDFELELRGFLVCTRQAQT